MISYGSVGCISQLQGWRLCIDIVDSVRTGGMGKSNYSTYNANYGRRDSLMFLRFFQNEKNAVSNERKKFFRFRYEL